ncbi:hypothetical protein H7B90_23730 [Cohnella xylanilytica]|uniref:Uncharacterized protein n=1 Tax=Cohnella xylanilytica TaxID=557555 RepID=A0A841U4D7_9BACL|nr:hypothetical protein [Cohnella xylanilytica]MBB6694412.1 hypothetical protein [Cohnella xylanilytica]
MLSEERLKLLQLLASEMIVTKGELRNAVDELVYAYRQLNQQYKQMKEALENINCENKREPFDYAEYWSIVSEIVSQTIRSVQGSESN